VQNCKKIFFFLTFSAKQSVGATCASVCGQLPTQFEEQVCGVICELVGIEALVTALQDLDPEPIDVCQDLTLCPTAANAAGNITSVVVSPKSGAVGSTFDVNVVFKITSAIGTGELVVEFSPPGGSSPFGSSELLVSTAPGVYAVTAQLDTQPSGMTSYPTGTYNVQIVLCEGTCGSRHATDKLLSMRTTAFRVTNDRK